jgi:hypothetical protein
VTLGWKQPAPAALALAAWCAVHVAALLRPGPGGAAPSRAAQAVAAGSGVAFVAIVGGVLAPHRPAAFALVLAVFAATQALLARRHRSPILLAPAALVSAGALVGGALHAHGSGSAAFVVAGCAWAAIWVAGAAEPLRRGSTPGPVTLAAAALAPPVFGVAAALVVPAGAGVARGLLLALAGAAPLALGAALRPRQARVGAALLALGLVLGGAAVAAAAGGAAATVVWALAATALVGGGFARGSALSRRLGLAVFGAAVLKLAAWDVWRLPPGYRIPVLLGVGALLLAASYLYARGGRPPATAPRPARPAASA